MIAETTPRYNWLNNRQDMIVVKNDAPHFYTRKQSGQSLTEYALIGSLVLVAAYFAFVTLGISITDLLQEAADLYG